MEDRLGLEELLLCGIQTGNDHDERQRRPIRRRPTVDGDHLRPVEGNLESPGRWIEETQGVVQRVDSLLRNPRVAARDRPSTRTCRSGMRSPLSSTALRLSHRGLAPPPRPPRRQADHRASPRRAAIPPRCQPSRPHGGSRSHQLRWRRPAAPNSGWRLRVARQASVSPLISLVHQIHVSGARVQPAPARLHDMPYSSGFPSRAEPIASPRPTHESVGEQP